MRGGVGDEKRRQKVELVMRIGKSFSIEAPQKAQNTHKCMAEPERMEEGERIVG